MQHTLIVTASTNFTIMCLVFLLSQLHAGLLGADEVLVRSIFSALHHSILQYTLSESPAVTNQIEFFNN